MPIPPTPRSRSDRGRRAVVTLGGAGSRARSDAARCARRGSSSGGGHELREVRRREARQGEPKAEAGRDRPRQPPGRPGPGRAAVDAGGRDGGEVRERRAPRCGRTPDRAEEVLHQEHRGGRHEVRPGRWRTTSASRSCSGVASSSATSRSTRLSARSRSWAGCSVHPIDETSKTGVYGLFGGNASVLSPYGTFARNVLKAKTAAVVYPTIPGIAEAGVSIVAAMRKAGLTVKQVAYDPNTTDLVGPITAAGGQSADVFVVQDVAVGVRQHGQGARTAPSHPEGAHEPALPRPESGCGPRRRLPEVDVRDRVVARLRPDGQERAALPEGLQEVRAGPEDHRRPVDARSASARR